MSIGPFEAAIIVLALVSSIWVFYDAQKKGYEKIHSVFLGLYSLLFIFPIGFIIYLCKTRLKRFKGF